MQQCRGVTGTIVIAAEAIPHSGLEVRASVGIGVGQLFIDCPA